MIIVPDFYLKHPGKNTVCSYDLYVSRKRSKFLFFALNNWIIFFAFIIFWWEDFRKLTMLSHSANFKQAFPPGIAG